MNGRLKEQLQQSLQSYVHATGAVSLIDPAFPRETRALLPAAQSGNPKVGANHAIRITADSPQDTNKNLPAETSGKRFRLRPGMWQVPANFGIATRGRVVMNLVA